MFATLRSRYAPIAHDRHALRLTPHAFSLLLYAMPFMLFYTLFFIDAFRASATLLLPAASILLRRLIIY